MPWLDAHAHFFYPGYVSKLPESCRRQSPDEITLYHAYAQQHEITQVLAIGYEGEAWATGNNSYLAELTSQYAWVRPMAFVHNPKDLTLTQLAAWQQQHFVGIVFYLFTPEAAAKLNHVPGEVWTWLVEHGWLVSVNSQGDLWSRWEEILNDHPGLHLLIAHLGLPPAASTALTAAEAHAVLEPVLRLASYPAVYVKFSGFYALAEPDYEFPHPSAWPYARAITEVFGSSRILWASDFSPALESVTFAQTVEVLNRMPWLSKDDHAAISHDNLFRLLTTIDERKPQQ